METLLLALMHNIPLWVIGIVIVVLAEIFAVGLMLFSRFTYGVSRLSLNNEVAGFKFAVVGVFYAVLLAFVVVAVWEEYQDTETAVRNEAKAVVDLQAVTLALPDEGGIPIRKHLAAYLQDVLKYEWKTMSVGEPSDVVDEELSDLAAAIFAATPSDERELALYQHALTLLTVIADNRDERLDSANGSVPAILWFVLIVESRGASSHDRVACGAGGAVPATRIGF
jgi:hypothetical protein